MTPVIAPVNLKDSSLWIQHVKGTIFVYYCWKNRGLPVFCFFFFCNSILLSPLFLVDPSFIIILATYIFYIGSYHLMYPRNLLQWPLSISPAPRKPPRNENWCGKKDAVAKQVWWKRYLNIVKCAVQTYAWGFASERRAKYISCQRMLRDFRLSLALNWYVSSYGLDKKRLTYQEHLLPSPNTSDRQESAAV